MICRPEALSAEALSSCLFKIIGVPPHALDASVARAIKVSDILAMATGLDHPQRHQTGSSTNRAFDSYTIASKDIDATRPLTMKHEAKQAQDRSGWWRDVAKQILKHL